MTPADIQRIKDLLPTTLGSDEIRKRIAADILRRSVFSARMASVPYLAKVREVCAAISAGEINQAEARARLLSTLAQLGYETVQSPKSKVQSTEEEVQGPKSKVQSALDIRPSTLDSSLDLRPSTLDSSHTSERRLNLIVDTQRQMAASVANLMQQDEGTLEQYPGWELCRMGSRMAPRKDWMRRWRSAGDSVGWEGARREPIYGDATAYGFLALKTSPIWQALGDGAGGFTDTLGNPYPPFCYASGMAWMDASRADCVRYGLVQGPKSKVQSPRSKVQSALDIRPWTLDTPSLSPGEKEILEAVERYGFEV